MKAKRPAGTNFLFSAILFSLFLFFSGLNAKGQSTCVQSGTGVWQNHAFTGQSSQFVVTYSATPSHAAMTGEVGFSVNAASSLTNLAVIVRFASTGAIDVRNGGSFSAATSYPYTAGTQYTFQLAINPATKRYSVFVTAPGGAQVELASNYAFRSSQSRVSSLNNWATYSTGGTETVCNMTIAGAGSSVTAPTISAQPASKTVTAGQTATFSVTASGTAPLSYQWAKNGAAISGATAASYTTPATSSTDNGSQFVVTVSNSAGSATSAAATLTVTSTPGTLSLSSSSLSFGSVSVGSSKALSTTLTNTGGSSVTVSSVSISGAGFNCQRRFQRANHRCRPGRHRERHVCTGGDWQRDAAASRLQATPRIRPRQFHLPAQERRSRIRHRCRGPRALRA